MGCSGCNAKRNLDRPAMLTVHDWLNDIPGTTGQQNIVEVRFKGTRKEFFLNEDGIPLKCDDLVVVSCSPGHDVGTVSLTGKLAEIQFHRKVKKPDRYEWNKIYRKATSSDTAKWEEAKAREQAIMIRARQIAKELKLSMKIGDVEFRGDNNKAIFYYIADDRVDFRELIKIYAREFAIKIEMKQIGVRQEAGRIGGIGSCGRALCCSIWRTDFSSVTSDAAIKQGLSPNVEKMAGRCSKLKCCLGYELDHYLEALDDFPNELLSIETEKGWAKHIKSDILQKKLWYSYAQSEGGGIFILDLKDVKKFLIMNKQGQKATFEAHLGTETKKENMMNVGELDQKLFEKTEPQKKRSNRNRRQQANRQQEGENNTQNTKAQENRAQTNKPQTNRTNNRPDGNRHERNRHNRNNQRGPKPENKG